MIMVLMNGAYVALQVAMGILHLYMYVCARATLTREGDVVATVDDRWGGCGRFGSSRSFVRGLFS